MKKQSGFASILAVIIAVVLIGGVGYLYYQSSQKGKQVKTETSANTSETKSTDPYAGWNTYTSSIERLSFKYPSDWVLTVDSAGNYASQTGITEEQYKLVGTNNFRINFDVFGNAGLGGACGPECQIYESTKLNVPNYGNLWMVVSGRAAGMATNIGLDSEPTAVGEGASYGLFSGKAIIAAGELKGQHYTVHMDGSYRDNNGDAISYAPAAFLAKSEVKTAKLIYQSLSY